MGSLKLLLVSVVLASAAPCQGVKEFDALLLPGVEKRLASERAADVAWGGYLAQRYRLRGAARPLVQALSVWQKQYGLKARFVRLHLADALVGIRAHVPGEQMEILLRDPLTRSCAFAILANDPLVNREALIELAMSRAPHGDMARSAAGRLLVAKKMASQKFGRHILDHLDYHLAVTVTDGASDDNQWNSAVGLGGTPPKEIEAPEGFPPLVRLTLMRSGHDEDTVRLLVPDRFGDSPVVLTREEGVTYKRYQLTAGGKQAADSSWAYAKLVGRIARVDLGSFESQTVQFDNAENYLKTITAARDERRAKLKKIVQRMRRDGWLAKDGPGVEVPLEIGIDDQRGDKSVPLPVLPDSAKGGAGNDR